ncbi:ribosome recycling factor [Moorella sp. Hama-1]|uniref:ribosome recycling factor n=1 Tax=Moorella sp. Hama-1 TaxID=2138101 RepID=UPI000D65CC50|nr:ribosome recycling factor [Moorella sp. Hama-1]MDN5362262.1 ribosome recycling factor [Moorella sp. (in: firmicutes)]BCV21118.1 ribosome-recycling factor [Moorella sp. Hama-1]
MLADILQETEARMQKAVEGLRRELASLRAGRANPALLEKVLVNYYGTPTPVNQLATISTPEARLLVIQPWDRNVLPEIEKAILKSDLGLTPSSDGTVIRIAIPQLTEERRAELVKVARKKAEEFRVIVRNARREANEKLKAQEKNKQASEDEVKRAQEKVQKATDNYIQTIDKVLSTKEAEIMEV